MENEPLTRPCPVCGANPQQALFRKGILTVVQCVGCSMRFANPIQADLASGQFYDRLGVPFYLSNDKLQSDYSPVRFERELRLFRSFCRQGAVLDVGCSTGGFLHALKTRFPGQYQVFGMDVAEAALDHAERQGVQVLRGSFLQHDFRTAVFEAVTFWAVLEHLVYPGQFLRQAARILKPGGFCFVLVPNMNSLAVRLLGPRYRYIMPDHVNYFDPKTLRRFVENEPSFANIHFASSHFNPVVILKDFRNPQDRVPDQERARLLKKTTAWKQNRWVRPAKWAYTGIEHCLARAFLADNLVMVLRKTA